jgi:DNA-binding response OmpR family regulator
MLQDSRHYKVLIVEDEPDIMELVKDTLSNEKYELLESVSFTSSMISGSSSTMRTL